MSNTRPILAPQELSASGKQSFCSMIKSSIYYPLYAPHLGHTKHAAYPGTTMVVSRQHGHSKGSCLPFYMYKYRPKYILLVTFLTGLKDGLNRCLMENSSYFILCVHYLGHAKHATYPGTARAFSHHYGRFTMAILVLSLVHYSPKSICIIMFLTFPKGRQIWCSMGKRRCYFLLYALHLGQTKHAAYHGTTRVVSSHHVHYIRPCLPFHMSK